MLQTASKQPLCSRRTVWVFFSFMSLAAQLHPSLQFTFQLLSICMFHNRAHCSRTAEKPNYHQEYLTGIVVVLNEYSRGLTE